LKGAFLDDIDKFDWRAFRIPPREAKRVDPQHRLLLEVAWEALEDAGITLPQIAGSQTGVFVGMSWNDYLRLQSRNWSQLDGYTVIGNCSTLAANRISYFFDLKGPSFSIDAGCASSHVALQCACQYLWSGQGTVALAGGVNIIIDPSTLIMVSRSGLISRQGYCKTFDALGDGFVLGEGAGILVLKPLSQVRQDDRLYALIRSIEVSHNGHNEWIMGTSLDAQKALLQRAYARAQIDPREVDYVEMHGAAFPRGDAVEARALGEVLAPDGQRPYPCYIGSLKPNMGNLISAAGVASIIKTALSLYYREIPAVIHLEQVNPAIPLQELHLTIPQAHQMWPEKQSTPTAGVTALSFTGVNAHAVLTVPPRLKKRTHVVYQKEKHYQMLLLSAHSEQALIEMAVSVHKQLQSAAPSSWYDFCYTSCIRRNHLRFRLAIPARSSHEAIIALEAFVKGTLLPGVSKGDAQENGASSDLIPPAVLEQKPDLSVLSELGQLYCNTYAVDWSFCYPEEGQCTSFPPYPWQKERLWLDWLDKTIISTPPETHGNAFIAHRESADKRLQLQAAQWQPSASTGSAPVLQKDTLVEYVTQRMKELLDIAADEYLSPHERLFNFGLTSIMAMQLMQQLQNYLQQPLSVTLLFRYPTIDSLCGYLTEQHREEAGNGPEAQSAPAVAQPATVDEALLAQCSEDEVEVLLLQKLAEIDRSLS
jgi:acyl transferase domain-containing protein